MKTLICIIALVSLVVTGLFAQTEKQSVALAGNKNLQAVNVKFSEANYQGVESIKGMDIGENSEVKFVKINDLDFKDGVIEIEIAGRPVEGAFQGARGFVGIAFRINEDNSKFECFYLRPTNGRADDQVRRNHSAQYISFPGYPWYKLRKETPEKYEAYVDLVPGEWTKVKIEVKGDKARLYVHGNEQPTLIVNDLKLGPDASGKIGLWIGPGTEAYFANLKIIQPE